MRVPAYYAATVAGDGANSATSAAASALSVTIVTFHPSLVHTRALASATSELARFIRTVSVSFSATISNDMRVPLCSAGRGSPVCLAAVRRRCVHIGGNQPHD